MLQEMALAEMMERKLSAFQAFLTTMAKRSRTKLLAGTEEEEDTGLTRSRTNTSPTLDKSSRRFEG